MILTILKEDKYKFWIILLVKFIYSEKATKVCEILHTVKSKGKISQNFVAFSEYMNFTENSSFELLRILSNCLRTKKYMHEGFSEQVGVCLPVGPLVYGQKIGFLATILIFVILPR